MSNFNKVIIKVKEIGKVLSIWSLGVVVGSTALYSHLALTELMETNTIHIDNPVKTAQIEETKEKEEWFKAEFSAYTASEDETDSSPSIMASGKKVYKGAIACPRALSFGSIVEIKDMGKFVCEDRMNIRYKNNFDIFMESKDEALSFGRKTLEYRII